MSLQTGNFPWVPKGTPVDGEIRLAAGVCIAERPEELDAIRQSGVGAAIWRRQPDTGFQAWIDALPPDQLPAMRAVVAPDRAAAAVEAACDINGTPEGPERERLVSDVAALAHAFAAIMSAVPGAGAPWLRIRLDVIDGDACRKFHLDQVAARLLCTYRGAGTQYGLWRADGDPQRVFSLATGAAAIFRGARWPAQTTFGRELSGIVHRSPPLEGKGETRLLLVIDAVAEPEDE